MADDKLGGLVVRWTPVEAELIRVWAEQAGQSPEDFVHAAILHAVELAHRAAAERARRKGS